MAKEYKIRNSVLYYGEPHNWPTLPKPVIRRFFKKGEVFRAPEYDITGERTLRVKTPFDLYRLDDNTPFNHPSTFDIPFTNLIAVFERPTKQKAWNSFRNTIQSKPLVMPELDTFMNDPQNMPPSLYVFVIDYEATSFAATSTQAIFKKKFKKGDKVSVVGTGGHPEIDGQSFYLIQQIGTGDMTRYVIPFSGSMTGPGIEIIKRVSSGSGPQYDGSGIGYGIGKQKQYIFTKDFTAERPKPSPGEAQTMQYIAPKKFTKGEVVLGTSLPNGTIISDGRDITDGVIEWKIGKGLDISTYFTTKNIIIGSAIAIGLIFLFRKLS